LVIGNDDEEKIKENKYNRFFGNIETLKNLTELELLHINNTDINGKLKNLPSNLEEICCSSQKRPESQVQKLEEQLEASNLFFSYGNKIYKKFWTNIHPDFTPELQQE
jgi:hypothetical protein